jgi:hypothetical protein
MVDGDGKWICAGIVGGTLAIAHDGSYMASDLAGVCLAGVIMYCRGTKQWLKASVAERSNDASNHQGKLLGAAMALLILRAASVTLVPLLPNIVLHCDKHGVISHNNSPLTSLPKKQQQSDLIRLIKYLVGTNICRTSWEWVEGHAVERKGWRRPKLPKHLNDQANKLAKKISDTCHCRWTRDDGLRWSGSNC